MPPPKPKAPTAAAKGGAAGFVGRLKSLDAKTWLIAVAAVGVGYILYQRRKGKAGGVCPDGSAPDDSGACPPVGVADSFPADGTSANPVPNPSPPYPPQPPVPGPHPIPPRFKCPPGFTQGGKGKCCPPGMVPSAGGCIRKKKGKGHTLGPVDHTQTGWTTTSPAGPIQGMPLPRTLGDPVPGYAG